MAAAALASVGVPQNVQEEEEAPLDIARVVGGRVDEGLMTEDEAIEIARKWFWDNPRELYRLKV